MNPTDSSTAGTTQQVRRDLAVHPSSLFQWHPAQQQRSREPTTELVPKRNRKRFGISPSGDRATHPVPQGLRSNPAGRRRAAQLHRAMTSGAASPDETTSGAASLWRRRCSSRVEAQLRRFRRGNSRFGHAPVRDLKTRGERSLRNLGVGMVK
jgi:hypothetical protein